MMNRDIEFLLDLYDREYVKGEVHRTEYKRNIRYETKRKNRHLLFDNILNESRIYLNNSQKRLIRYLIDDFNRDFKELHRRASEECIILAFIFFLKKIEVPSIRLEDYSITAKYNLTDNVFEIIICRMLLNVLKRCPIKPTAYNKADHDILVKEGRR